MAEFKPGQRVRITDRYIESQFSHNFRESGNVAEFERRLADGYCSIVFENAHSTVLPIWFIESVD